MPRELCRCRATLFAAATVTTASTTASSVAGGSSTSTAATTPSTSFASPAVYTLAYAFPAKPFSFSAIASATAPSRPPTAFGARTSYRATSTWDVLR